MHNGPIGVDGSSITNDVSGEDGMSKNNVVEKKTV